MRDELTAVDIRKMREELDHRIKVLRPQMIAEVQRCRAYGDLSENFEYKEAKREKNRNDSRIRYLERMIKTAKVVRTDHAEGTVGLFDTVVIKMGGMERTITIVTTLRQNPLKGLISKESPVGKALLGRKAGDTVWVVPDGMAPYEVTILSVTRGKDDDSLEISKY
jgi:transcription elongation factor GreA